MFKITIYLYSTHAFLSVFMHPSLHPCYEVDAYQMADFQDNFQTIKTHIQMSMYNRAINIDTLI